MERGPKSVFHLVATDEEIHEGEQLTASRIPPQSLFLVEPSPSTKGGIGFRSLGAEGRMLQAAKGQKSYSNLCITCHCYLKRISKKLRAFELYLVEMKRASFKALCM